MGNAQKVHGLFSNSSDESGDDSVFLLLPNLVSISGLEDVCTLSSAPMNGRQDKISVLAI